MEPEDWKRFCVVSVFMSGLRAGCLQGLGVRTEAQRFASGEVLRDGSPVPREGSRRSVSGTGFTAAAGG